MFPDGLLVLGLLVATAKNKYDISNQQIEKFAASLMLLNRELTNYGPEARDAKDILRKYTITKIAETCPGGPEPKPGPGSPSLEAAREPAAEFDRVGPPLPSPSARKRLERRRPRPIS
jgi:hypothetical protein